MARRQSTAASRLRKEKTTPTKGPTKNIVQNHTNRGKIRPLRDSVTAIGLPVLQDQVTLHERTLEKLRRDEERYRTIIETMQDAYYEINLNGNYTFVNDALCRTFGYTKEEMIGAKSLQSQDEANAKKMFQVFRKVYRTGDPVKALETEYTKRNGTKGTYEISVSLMRDGQDKPIGYRGIARDVTERKQAEQALRTSEERYRNILESIQDGYFECDIAGTFTFVNDSMADIFGYSKEELVGMNDREYTDHENAKRLFEAFNRVYKTGERGKVVNYEITRKDGVKKHVETSFSLLKDLSGKATGFRGIIRDITERKQAEEALRKSEQRYRNILESIQDGYFENDLAGNLTFINDIACKHLGYTRDELIGLNYRKYANEENATKLYENYHQLYRTGEPFKLLEVEYIRKDGTKLVDEISVSLMRNSEGKKIGFRGTSRDITARKKAEEILRQSEERYRSILESLQDGYFENDLAGNMTFVNDVVCRHLGYTREELIGKNYREYTDKEAFQEIFQRYNNLYGTGIPFESMEQVLVRKDRTKGVYEVSASLIRDSEGKPIGFRGTSRDTTERKEAEEALRKSEERYRTIIENLQDGYFENDLTGKFTFVNDIICRNLRYTKEELLGLGYRQYTDEENARKLHQIYNQLYSAGKPIKPFEAEYLRKDGAKLFAEISVSLITDAEGKPIGFRGISHDITERKQVEEEKLSLQEQLRQSQKMEAIGQLAGGVAHDFNNLLTVIKGYSQLSLLDLKEDSPLRANVQEIEKATQRATDLTRQLLAFSRRQILDLKVLDLNTLLKDLEKMLRRIIGEDIELITYFSEGLGKVKLDPSQIEQVIFNLAVNARDAMPAGGRLAIETANVELDEQYAQTHISVGPGRYVRLSVSDTGVGMTQEVKEKIFEPFFTTKGKGKGTGLGLSMVYGIVKQSGGNIWVYSEPGRGTTFRIYFPRTDEEADILHDREQTDEFPRGSETILLVEDDELVRDLAHRLLKQQGYTVLVAANGQEALRIAKEHVGETIHLLLADIVMPQMGGKELSDWLKISRPNVKVLFTSGYADNAIVHHGVLDPGTHFLQKPFSLKTLSHKVREVLDG